MKLKEDLLRGIYAYGFEKPSAIQQRAIVPCIKVVIKALVLVKGGLGGGGRVAHITALNYTLFLKIRFSLCS